jgi:hypothetical protein
MDVRSLSSQKYDIGRCVVFYADPAWDGLSNLFAAGGPLIHLGTTEGEVVINPNPEYSNLVIEPTGPAILKRYITGTAPTFSLGLFPDLDQMKVVSPSGIASLGFERQRLAKVLTLWIVPEALFLKPDANNNPRPVPVVLTAGVWLKDGVALTAEEERLLFISSLCWRCDVQPMSVTYKHEDGGKSLSQVEVTVQHDFDRPEGCQQILVLGEAFDEYPVFDSSVLDFEPV